MNKKYNKGFTLIELLVVIAIIGILSGVVLVNLGGESNKARDARIKAGMAQIRTAMESARAADANLAYGDPDTVGSVIITDITSANNGGRTFRESHSTSAWCAQITLNVSGSWCVDSSGFAGLATGCPANSTTDFSCK